ncbi:galactosylceramide sulfotransferase-like isoform X1 [Haliotis rufescens]|uniref:galactosylceramide sulfotransferase-like isoform X1 n=1 Tax=Haliotis rufescens TaxID=6454 RepID=UPI00201EC82F|nr:galactosylceramide sulfotransferase-like isoform X1 [Haliotis rufescens]
MAANFHSKSPLIQDLYSMELRLRRRRLRTLLLYVVSISLIIAVLMRMKRSEKGAQSKTHIEPPIANEVMNDVTVPEVHHVVFLKVHKAASSTLMNIFMRFGISRNLNVMVPKTLNVFSQSTYLHQNQFLHYSPSGLYDILCCHVVYRKASIAPYFPADTRYIGIVREPFQQFLSAFLYYRHLSYLKKISGDNPVSTYLQDPLRYEPGHALSSYTNNRMTFDFGYPFKEYDNTSYMYDYVDQLVSELDFVIVVEYFDESMLMLKQLLGWTLKDMLYIPRKYGERRNTLTFTREDRERHKQWARLDHILYKRFLNILLKKLDQKNKLFYEELDTFKDLRAKMEHFCTATKKEELFLPKSTWNENFTVSRKDCDLMQMNAIPLINLVRGRYIVK